MMSLNEGTYETLWQGTPPPPSAGNSAAIVMELALGQLHAGSVTGLCLRSSFSSTFVWSFLTLF